MLALLAILTSCSNYHEAVRFPIEGLNASIAVYRQGASHATVSESLRLILEKQGTDEVILEGSGARKVDIEYDKTARTIIIYFCGGIIDHFRGVAYINGETYVIQPIITNFLTDSSRSVICKGNTFYSIQGH